MFKFFQGKDGQFYFNIMGENNKVMATSEGYTRVADAYRGARDLTQRVLTFSANMDPGDIEHPHVEPGETQA